MLSTLSSSGFASLFLILIFFGASGYEGKMLSALSSPGLAPLSLNLDFLGGLTGGVAWVVGGWF